MSEKNIFNTLDSEIDTKIKKIKKEYEIINKFSNNIVKSRQLEKLRDLISNYESCNHIKSLQNFYAKKTINYFNTYFQ